MILKKKVDARLVRAFAAFVASVSFSISFICFKWWQVLDSLLRISADTVSALFIYRMFGYVAGITVMICVIFFPFYLGVRFWQIVRGEEASR